MLVLEKKRIQTTNILAYELLNSIVYKKLGGDNATVSVRLRKMVDDAVSEIRKAADPRGMWRYASILSDETGMYLDDLDFPVKSRKISSVLRNASYAVVFAVTLGPDVDDILHNPDLTTGDRLVLDTVASVAVESCMDTLHTRLYYEALPEYIVTHRYSPGYCDWHVSQQKHVFRFLSTDRIGLTLNESCLMNPRKSITAVLGVGEEDVIREEGNACLSCGKTRCPFRRTSSLFEPVY